MAIVNIITANCENNQLSQQMVSRQWDDKGTLIQFAGYPEPEGDEALIFRLIVWMKESEDAEPRELPPILLDSDQWLISNYYTQLVQTIKFQLCITNETGTYEKHSPVFAGHIGRSLSHNGQEGDIDVIPLFDPYMNYVDEKVNDLIVAAGDVQIDASLSTSGAAADAKATGDAIAGVNGRLGVVKSAVSEEIVGTPVSTANIITGTQVYYNSQYNLLGFRARASEMNVAVYPVEAGHKYYVTGYGKSGENDPAAVLAVNNVSSGTTSYFDVVDGEGSSYSYKQSVITPAQDGYIYVNIDATNVKTGLNSWETINNLLPDVTYLKQQTLAYMLQSYTIKNGYYMQNSASYTPNISYFSVYESCNPGEKFKISSRIKDAIVPYVQFYKQDETVLSWIPNSGTLPEDVTNYEYVVPDGAAYFSVTSYQIRPVVQKYTLAIDQTEHFPLYLHRRNALAEVMCKYSADNDVVYLFNKVGPSSIMQIAGYDKLPNTEMYCSGDFTKARTHILQAGTDWMSPYKVIAVNNADGDGAGQGVNGYYTGGFHAYDNSQSGVATGRTSAYKLFIDNKEITDTADKVYEATDSVTLEVTNLIQGNNTTKEDGTGREILQEKIIYTITPNRIDIVNTITALEDIIISQYYGLQLYLGAIGGFSGFSYYGDTVENHDFSVATSYTKEIDSLIGGLDGDANRIVCQLDKKGIGRHQYIKSGGIMARSIAGRKVYNSLVDNSPNYLPLSTGDSVFISGHYAFAEGHIPN